ncbi:RrF2 family transcriptional regulator [Domibacillus robiginosus]|uniref:RrF2 family transcriptional regulator n=1 Tax=Domibacillus robiginosus TaxID=1071054 RepID=UPI00067E2560|nr:Rrf2 family transcriptional regulator [Domibacillus robiginosus]
MNSNFTIAVHSLVYLAYLPGHMASSETIAHNVATNPARVRKVMSALRNEGFVKTKEGVRGGYMLDEDPGKITLGHVYEAIARGALQPSWQTGDPKCGCPISSNTQTVMDFIFKEAEDSYASFLHQFTVAAVLLQIKAGT